MKERTPFGNVTDCRNLDQKMERRAERCLERVDGLTRYDNSNTIVTSLRSHSNPAEPR
jgi:hypothetical protein